MCPIGKANKMAPYPKQSYIEKAREELHKAEIMWLEYNNGIHFKIGTVNFWPTTGKWIDDGIEARGVKELIKYLNTRKAPVAQASNGGAEPPIQKLTIANMVKIYQITNGSLYDKLESIHKEIYKYRDDAKA